MWRSRPPHTLIFIPSLSSSSLFPHDTPLQVADLLVAVIVEFSSSRNAKSAAMGLPLEFHRTAHAEFEQYGLELTLQLGMDLLSKCVAEWQTPGATSLSSPPPALLAARQRLFSSVTLCNELLSWEHGWLDVWSIPAPNKAVRRG